MEESGRRGRRRKEAVYVNAGQGSGSQEEKDQASQRSLHMERDIVRSCAVILTVLFALIAMRTTHMALQYNSDNNKNNCRCDQLKTNLTLEKECLGPFSQCGRPEPGDRTRIVGGSPSRPGDHPWQVSLQRRTTGSSAPFSHTCGGVLIASCWVLTAASCSTSSMDMQVVLGGVDIERHEESDQVIPVVRAIVHPDYNPTTYHNDVALLQLTFTNSPLCAMETHYVKTACLPKQPFSADMSQRCVVAGWVARERNGPSNRLLGYQVSVLSKQSCMAAYGDRVDDGMICAGHMEGGVYSCMEGNGGGPLVCGQEGIQYVAGVLSWGPPCPANKPDVFSNVHRYVDWINETMSKAP